MVYRLDLALRELSGMDRFVFQPGGGADASYLQACITRAYHDARGELSKRDEVITTIQAHPCNSATAAAAGFKVITLPLEEKGYPSLAALQSALSERTAALFVNNPDDMGIYNPEITDWVDAVHGVGGLCFYDHANFNGVMGKIRAAELGFDACMFMLHKTFGAPKGGGGPAVGAYGCSERWPLICRARRRFRRRPLPDGRTGRRDRPGPRVHRQLPSDFEGVRLGQGHGRRGHQRGLGPFRTGQQLHGRPAAAGSPASPARTRRSPGRAWR